VDNVADVDDKIVQKFITENSQNSLFILNFNIYNTF